MGTMLTLFEGLRITINFEMIPRVHHLLKKGDQIESPAVFIFC